jgi:hypothetical protein
MSNCDDMPPLIDDSDVEYAHNRENIFHTRCQIQNKVCNRIVDSGIYATIASVTLIRKLGLSIIRHERPYQLQWLNEYSVVKINRQVFVRFLIGKYNDKVLCDVVPMYVTHLLLGRLWQFDRKAKHDGFKNKYFLEKDGRVYTLAPLSPKQVYEEQMRLKKDFDLKQLQTEHHGEGGKVKIK